MIHVKFFAILYLVLMINVMYWGGILPAIAILNKDVKFQGINAPNFWHQVLTAASIHILYFY
jgi:hypothetical protein